MKALTQKEVVDYWVNQCRIAEEEAAVYRAALRRIAEDRRDPQKIALEALDDDEDVVE